MLSTASPKKSNLVLFDVPKVGDKFTPQDTPLILKFKRIEFSSLSTLTLVVL